MEQVTLKITGMSCGSCVNKIETALKQQEGVEQAKVNLKKGIVKLKYDGSIQSSDKLNAVIQEVGYEAEPIK